MVFSGCEAGAVRFIEHVFHDCVYGLEDGLGFVLGMVSILLWITAQLPQFIDNIKNQSAEALSVWFLAQWFLGDTLNLLGCLMSGEQLATTTALAMYFVLSDVIMLTQFVYYGALQRRKELEVQRALARKSHRKHHHHHHHPHQHHHQSGGGGGDGGDRSFSRGGHGHRLTAADGGDAGGLGQPGTLSPGYPSGGSVSGAVVRQQSHSGKHHRHRSQGGGGAGAGGNAGDLPQQWTAITVLQGDGGGAHDPPAVPCSAAGLQQGSWGGGAAAAAGVGAGVSATVAVVMGTGMVLSLLLLTGVAGAHGGGGFLGLNGAYEQQGHALQQHAATHPHGTLHHTHQQHQQQRPRATATRVDAHPGGTQHAERAQQPGGAGVANSASGQAAAGAGQEAWDRAASRADGDDDYGGDVGGDGGGGHWWDDTDRLVKVLGAVFGYCSAALYLSSRFSQIYKNWSRQSAEGLSVMMFLFTISANVCTGMSIVLRLKSMKSFKVQLPWICGTFGTVGLDACIYAQAMHYNQHPVPHAATPLPTTPAMDWSSHSPRHPHAHHHRHHRQYQHQHQEGAEGARRGDEFYGGATANPLCQPLLPPPLPPPSG